MAKRPSKHLRAPRPLSTGHFAQVVTKADGEWMVHRLSAGASTKTYTCPGCNQSVTPGAAHVVAWPREPVIGSSSAVSDRRHWHTPCWERRG